MPKIYKPFERKPTVYSNSGNRYYREARVIFAPDGNMSLEYGKERDRHLEIQSYKDSTDVNQLIRRYENGDQTALLRNHSGVFCDAASLPKNIHEAHRLSRDVENLYSSMGSDIKQAYPDVASFAEAFSSRDNFNKFMTVVNSRKVESEVKSDA